VEAKRVNILDITRRTLVGGAVGVGATALAVGCAPQAKKGNPVSRENAATGSPHWRAGGASGTRPADDVTQQVKAFASTTSLVHGQRITFHVATAVRREYTVTVHRMGHYRGAGARLMTTSPRLHGTPQPPPSLHPGTTAIRCDWPESWSFEVPSNWISGLYVASFTTADGYRTSVPFVVRDAARQSEFLVVLPFTTYQAYNQYPMDGVHGRSLYYGYLPSAHAAAVHEKAPDGHAYPIRAVPKHTYVLHYPERSRTVSFQRPYSNDGMPKMFDHDLDFITWAEGAGLDVTYASSFDLHDGLIDPAHHKALIFSGHDEYWSVEMRRVAERAVSGGTGMALFSANNMYWKVRIERGTAGFPVMTCFKTDPDPNADPTGPTTMWRQTAAHGAKAEQGLLGNQYNGIVRGTAPLVITEPTHWFWAGSGVTPGEQIPGMVRGEADGVMADMPRPAAAEHVLLSASPFHYGQKQTPVQNTSLYRAPSGAWVFDAGTFGWTAGLGGTAAHHDPRNHRATRNLIRRLRA
jgi:hypothetical protein